MNRKPTKLPMIAVVVILACPLAFSAQEATEQFIPIGRSPDLSNRVTVIGTVAAVDPEARSIAVEADGETVSAEVTEDTRIFLDKSKIQETNTVGEFGDLEEGARVEVLYQGRERASSGPAEWIKVEVTR